MRPKWFLCDAPECDASIKANRTQAFDAGWRIVTGGKQNPDNPHRRAQRDAEFIFCPEHRETDIDLDGLWAMVDPEPFTLARTATSHRPCALCGGVWLAVSQHRVHHGICSDCEKEVRT